MAGEQATADPVERVGLVAAVPEAGLLGPAADLVERRAGEADDVEVIDHETRARQSPRPRPWRRAGRGQ